MLILRTVHLTACALLVGFILAYIDLQVDPAEILVYFSCWRYVLLFLLWGVVAIQCQCKLCFVSFPKLSLALGNRHKEHLFFKSHVVTLFSVEMVLLDAAQYVAPPHHQWLLI